MYPYVGFPPPARDATARSFSPVRSRGNAWRRSSRRIPGARARERVGVGGRRLDAMKKRRRSLESWSCWSCGWWWWWWWCGGGTNKTQAHPSFVRAPPPFLNAKRRKKKRGESDRVRRGVKYFVFFCGGRRHKKRRGRNKRNEVCGKSGERSPESGGERGKKWERGGSRSCFRHSQLIDRRIEWLFLLHFYSSPLHQRHP